MEDKNQFQIPRKVEIMAFLVLAVSAFFIRAHYLSADPPVDLTTSQDVYTDPAQYTSYARNFVLYGSFNPLHDFRLVFFLKSVTTLLALLVFKLAGVGYAQSNFVGLIFSYSTILLLYFALRKMAGSIAALFYLVLISVDYNQIFYGRLPFLENSMNFFGMLAFTIMVLSRKIWPAVLAGIFLGSAIFFSKLIGLIYLFPFACFAAHEYFHNYRGALKKYIERYLLFGFGFLSVAIFWYFFSYRPLAQSVSGYVEEQAFDLYGMPMALQSIWVFLHRFLSLGAKSKLFSRMSVVSILAWIMILIFFYRAGSKENWKSKLRNINPGIPFFVALTVGAYGALMIWNYRPLRYQTILIYPIYALAGVYLSSLVKNNTTHAKQHWSFPILLFLLLSIPIFQIAQPIFDFSDVSFYTSNQPIFFIGAMIVITAGLLLLKKYVFGQSFILPSTFKRAVVLLAVAGAIIPSTYNYLDWSRRATFSTVADSKDLASILSPEAVVSGPFAADLTQDNILQNLIHMFGVANVDTAFFRKYPITHLILDKSNEEYAKKNYPQLMEKADLITHYYIGTRKALLYRVAGLTGNMTADQYQKSSFEQAISHYLKQNSDSGNYFMKRFQLRNPNNLTANYVSGVMAFDLKYYKEAEYFLGRSVKYSPTDFHLRYKMGELYIKMSEILGKNEYREKGMIELDAARKYNPSSVQLKGNIENLLSAKKVTDLE